MAIYMDPTYGDDQRILQPEGKAPTFLHSWGNVNRPCPYDAKPHSVNCVCDREELVDFAHTDADTYALQKELFSAQFRQITNFSCH